MRAGLLLLIATVLAYWPTWSFEGWGGTENRRVEIAREMLATGDFLVPTLGEEPTVAKPPFYYWVLAKFAEWFGDGMYSMRAPSVISMWLLAWLAYCLLRRSHDELVGWLAAFGLLTSPALLYHCSYAEIDPMFSVFTAASIWLLGHGVGFERRSALVAAGLLGGLAMMTKGPPYLLFLLGPMIVAARRRRLLAFLWVLPLAIAPLLIWYSMAASAGSAESVQNETIGRLAFYEWHHITDIPMHFLRAGLIMLPFGLFTFAEFRGAHRAGSLDPSEIQQRFCTSAALGGVLLLAIFPGKPVRYALPAVCLFVFGVAPAVAGFLRYPAPLGPFPLRLVRGLAVFGAVVLCALPFAPFPLPGRSVWFALGLAVGGVLVTSRTSLVVYAFVIPVLANWTVIDDRAQIYEHGTRGTEDVRLLLEEALVRNDVEDVSTYGHFTYSHLFDFSEIVPGDEFMRRQPTTEWLLVEHRGQNRPRPPGYADRVSIRARRRTIVLQQRVP